MRDLGLLPVLELSGCVDCIELLSAYPEIVFAVFGKRDRSNEQVQHFEGMRLHKPAEEVEAVKGCAQRGPIFFSELSEILLKIDDVSSISRLAVL